MTHLATFPENRRRSHRRGIIFVIALGIIVVVSAMLLVFAQQMRIEAIDGGGRIAQAKADAIEQGAEQWVLAQVEANVTPLSGSTSTSSSANANPVDPTSIPAEAIQIGDGYFWLLRPDPTQDQTYGFGITDESGKLNLNSATVDQLSALPNLTSDQATLISEWPGTTGSVGGTLTFESVQNLLLVDPSITPQTVYGYDLNHDGVIDTLERNASNGAAITNGTTTDSRGIFNFVTVYSTSATPGTLGTTAPARNARGIIPQTIGLVNVNTASAQVLECLPGMTSATADTIISSRPTTPTWGDTSWLSGAGASIIPYVTGSSYQYSADIVAVSGDGKAFKRVRIVVDARTFPATIVYRKDLTSLGFPLPTELQQSLRSGKGVPQDLQGTTNAQGTGF
jgi:DNA uptake protein ComE-like DNA-binding protein